MRARGSDPELDLERYDAEVLRSLVRGTLAVTDEALFQSTATELASLLGARAVIAGELGPDDPSTFRAVVTYVDGELASNHTYPVPRSEWEEILSTGALHVERRAHTRFAGDSWIGSIGGERLLGIPLVTDGQVIGLIAVVDPSSERGIEQTRGILKLFARGLAVEMGRLRRERLERERSGAALSHRGALLYLAQMHEPDLHAALRTIVKTTAETLGIERVSYWSLADDRSYITCEELYQRSTRAFHRGVVLHEKDVPSYFAAMLANVAIVAHDARYDPRTSEFTHGYFEPHGITSMLDVPVWRHGRLVGVLCHEHIGPMRTWREDETDFATSAAGMCSVALEAAERHRAEERYELIARATNDVLWDWNLTTNELTWSGGITSVMRYPPEEVGPTIDWWNDRIHADDRAAAEASIHGAIAGSATSWESEYRFLRGDGSVAWVVDRGIIVRAPDGRATRMVGAMIDVTEKREIEARLITADRMASIGTLAAGVAHEINNPLAYIMANIDFALESLDPTAPTELAESLREARVGASRVRTIVRDLRAFSRSEDEAIGPLDLRKVIEASINMVWNEIRHRARLVKDFGTSCFVDANEARLGQVVINLLVNAAQAIREGAAEDNEIRILTGVDRRGHAFIEVRDSGPGIPEAIRDRVFDPFFTTKAVGHGTGLGLSICHSIVTGLGGEITIGEGSRGRGCAVRVTLPCAAGPAPAEAVTRDADERPPVVKRSVLVVDDDVRVGIAIQRLLRTEWDVHVVASAREAIARVEAGGTFDVVLCDLMMPEMTGMDLHAELLRVQPALAERTVFMTGGTFTQRAQDFLEEIANPRLDKPFDRQTLTDTLHAVADGR